MNFEIEYIEKLANLADEKQLTEITVEDGDKAIIIKRGMQGAQAITPVSVPAAPQVLGYSVDQISSSVGINRIIEDNVDRFFNVEPAPAHPLKWIAEVDQYNVGCNAILNNQRIALITYPKRDAQWENPKPDINAVDAFDLDKFKQSYFAKMDFISHFE